MPPKPHHVPVSTLARFAADPDGLLQPRTRAMEKAAAHGVRWHEQLGRGGGRRASGWGGWLVAGVFLVAAIAAWLFLAP